MLLLKGLLIFVASLILTTALLPSYILHTTLFFSKDLDQVKFPGYKYNLTNRKGNKTVSIKACSGQDFFFCCCGCLLQPPMLYLSLLNFRKKDPKTQRSSIISKLKQLQKSSKLAFFKQP